MNFLGALCFVGGLMAVNWIVPDARAETLSGEVVSIVDGDTLEILCERPGGRFEERRIRIAAIDAPELGQAYGRNAKRVLARIVFHHLVVVDVVAFEPARKSWQRDRYVGRVWSEDRDVGLSLIQEGAAWAYLHYRPPLSYLAAQDAAMSGHRGLWALQADQREAPWDWRHEHEA